MPGAALKVTPCMHSLVPKFSPLITIRSPGLASSGSTLRIFGRLLRSHTGSALTLFSSKPLIDSASYTPNPDPSISPPCWAHPRVAGSVMTPIDKNITLSGRVGIQPPLEITYQNIRLFLVRERRVPFVIDNRLAFFRHGKGDKGIGDGIGVFL